MYGKLEVFYKVTLLFSGRKFPTANLFFKEICEIKLALAEWLSSDQLVVREMAEKMTLKFDKYWSSVNGLLAVAAVLDPRDKMGCVEYYFNEIYGDLAEMEIDRVRSLLYDLLAEYQDKDETNQGDYAFGESQVRGKLNVVAGSSHKAIGAKLSRWDIAKKTMKKKVSVRTELDNYLDEDPLPVCDEFDVLAHWKVELRYPTLRKIAKDILAIPASTVASESAFSAGGRLVSPHRCKLHPKTVEALACLQNWMLKEFVGKFISLNIFQLLRVLNIFQL